MKHQELQVLYHSLDPYEINILQQSRDDFERIENIRFTNLQAYVGHLAMTVIDKQCRGEFVPRSIEEARAANHP